jgi:hypothetical protein
MIDSIAMGRIFSGIKRRATGLRIGVGTIARKILRTSDKSRWRGESDLLADWDSRTQQLAALIEPGASVLEFGAGRRRLQAFLPENCTYTPSDIVDRGGGTIVCDLNSDRLPRLPQHDVAVFSGVLEYVNDVPQLIAQLSPYCKVIIASYAAANARNRSRMKRRAAGWVNDFSSSEIIEIFRVCGFDCDFRDTWRSQELYRFPKSKKT